MKVTHEVTIKVTGYYYTIRYNGGLSKQVARHTVTDAEWQTLVRTWGGGLWGGPRLVDYWWPT